MGLLLLCAIYWAAVGILFLVGLVQLITKSSRNEPVKPALKLLIISVCMLIVGVGACAAILSGLGNMH